MVVSKLLWQVEVEKVTLHPIAMPLVTPFETSFGRQDLRAGILVELRTTGGAVGWGEVVADWHPGYSYETIHTALHVLNDFLIPRLLQTNMIFSNSRWDWLNSVRGHPMAKHALISAILTAAAAELDIPLAFLLHQMSNMPQERDSVEVGVSIGLQPTIDALLERIQFHLNEGYSRIKLKIKPGQDVKLLREVRRAFPDIALTADANSAYTLDDLDRLRQLDEFDLTMIEQPLGYDDIYQHNILQKQIKTPICLDESIHTVGHAQLAWELGACQVLNLKPQRVGGLYESLRIHYYCHKNNIPLWVGGMLETGVGRAISLALASLPGITMPSDLSETRRYYNPDLADPPFELIPGTSRIRVPTAPGLGVTVDRERLEEAVETFHQAVNR